MQAIVDQLRASDSGFRCDVTEVDHYPLLFIDPEHELVAATRAARADALGDPGELGAWRFGVNGTFMAQAGIPTVGFDPGDERWAHTPEEHVLVEDLVTAARVYAHLAIRVCGVAAGVGRDPVSAERRDEA